MIFKKSKLIRWQSYKIWGTVLILLVVGIGIGAYINTTVPAAVMFINGQRIGIVSSIDQGEQLIQTILKEKGQVIEKPASTHDKIEYKLIRLQKIITCGNLKTDSICNNLTTYVDGVELHISNEKVATLSNQENIENALTAFKNYYANPSDSNRIYSVSFIEEVTTKQIETQPEEIQTETTVLEKLKEGKLANQEYVVKDTDTWWLIARNHDMLIKDVLAANPGNTEDSVLQAGQKINLISSAPYLTVISKGVLTQSEIIPYEVQTIIDDSLATNEQVVKQQGIEGSKQITVEYTQTNGTIIEKQIIDEQITKQPVTQIVSKGPIIQPYTIAYASSRGTGSISGLRWPFSGYISSPYGNRSRNFHKGIDIAGRSGTPFVAAASGTVVEAGWSGGYGNMILIDHGNGVKTRYGHASKILVSAGQHVTKGQTIALLGSTGISTGPHLHFEVIVNGNAVNPINYLP
ncbi:MAG: peptidoglycan DD-metalloendopeptidase family protein [Desulfitobacteriaceae bacterium]|nr:peptidoglycan DD-metalloendopeptidase family protein [Desulfitobacteriaceae bacterium]